MSKTINTLAALFVAAIAFPSAADAGGIRLHFGGPLGWFVAHPHLSSGPGGSMRSRYYDDDSRTSERADCKRRSLAQARRARAIAQAREARKEELARAAAAETHRHKAQSVQTAKLEDKTVATDAPVIYVPEAPAPQAQFTGTQSTPAPDRTASVENNPTNTGAGLEAENKTEVVVLPVVEDKDTKPSETAQAKPAETQTKPTVSQVAEKICRRFSAAIASMVTVPCN